MPSLSKQPRRLPGGDDVPIRVEVCALCDYAANENGRLTLVRTFEVVNASAVPVTLRDTTVALRMRFWPSEIGVHHFALHLMDPDGVPSMEPIIGTFEVVPFRWDRAGGYNFIVKLPELHFATWGEYCFDFYLNDIMEVRMPLLVDAPK